MNITLGKEFERRITEKVSDCSGQLILEVFIFNPKL